jgi:excisionase family DNA binding protein
MEKLWTTVEVARRLNVTEDDVEQLVREGRLTGYRLGGRFLRFRPDEVDALKRTVPPRPRAARPDRSGPQPWSALVREFVYGYDFYLVSAALLAVLVLYLIASG